MRYPLLTFGLLFAWVLSAQSPYCGMLTQPTGSFTVASNQTYASPVNAFGFSLPLQLDVYMPTGVSATSKRPLVLFIHGGAFVVGSRTEMAGACEEAAKRGYVAATMSYRLAWPGVNLFNLCGNDINEFTKGALRATQDARSALEYLYGQADTYGIDTNFTVVAGYSAGALTAINTAFIDQAEAYALEPSAEGLGAFPTISGIKAVISLAGALSHPQTMNNNSDKLFISAHGTCDDVVPYDSGPVFECDNFPAIYGDAYLQNKADSLGMSRGLLTVCNGTHDITGFLTEALDSIFFMINQNIHCNLPVNTQWHVKTSPACDATADLYPGCINNDIADVHFMKPLVVPNPSSGDARLTHLPSGSTVRVIDNLGQVVVQAVADGMPVALPAAGPGVFMVSYTTPDGRHGMLTWVVGRN
jgi:predicted esterase